MRGILILIICITEVIFGLVVACADTIVNLHLTGFGLTFQDCLRQGKRLTICQVTKTIELGAEMGQWIKCLSCFLLISALETEIGGRLGSLSSCPNPFDKFQVSELARLETKQNRARCTAPAE